MEWNKIWFDRKKAQVFRKLMNVGWRITDGRITPPEGSLNFDSPWIFVEEALHPHCMLWNHVFFANFRLIPRFCRLRCHKVVAKPRNVAELFDLLNLMEHLNVPSKCGVDRRNYTSVPYAAFFYCNSLEGGQARYKQIREAINEHIPDGENMPVILKKGCTEMEDLMDGGSNSDTWGLPTPADEELEDRLMMIFDFRQTSSHQPEWLRNHIKYSWLEHAYAIGDSSWSEICDDIFGVHSVTYHETEEPTNGS